MAQQPENREGPAGNGTNSKTTTGDAIDIPSMPEVTDRGRLARRRVGRAMDLDLIHAAWVAGYDQGLAHGQQMAVRHMAHELLHRQAAEMAGVAVTEAEANHGPGWASEIRRQAEGGDAA